MYSAHSQIKFETANVTGNDLSCVGERATNIIIIKIHGLVNYGGGAENSDYGVTPALQMLKMRTKPDVARGTARQEVDQMP